MSKGELFMKGSGIMDRVTMAIGAEKITNFVDVIGARKLDFNYVYAPVL